MINRSTPAARVLRLPASAAVLSAILIFAAPTPAQQLELFVEGLTKPVDMVADPSKPGRFYVVEQPGAVRIIEDGKLLPEPFFVVDKSDFTDVNWEQGLLGMALDPGWPDNRRFYLNYTAEDDATHVSRFTAESPYRAEPASEQVLLRIEQPYKNHNCGSLRFGPDGMLYIGTGDGGAANDPLDAGQRLDTLLGKMLRIDVTGAPDPGKPYAVPKDNPFVDREGVPGEIWSYGLRNPWRYEFDSQGRMWIADVGQNRFEEIHLQPAGSRGGENYGWKIMEGRGEFKPGNRGRDPEPLPDAEHRERGMEPPIWQYSHKSNGGVASVTGGYLYEGEGVPSLKGRYIYADFMSGRVWSFVLTPQGSADDVVEHTREFAPAFGKPGPMLAISSFARDPQGELYVLDLKSGRVFRIIE